jgi:hypothetical protein
LTELLGILWVFWLGLTSMGGFLWRVLEDWDVELPCNGFMNGWVLTTLGCMIWITLWLACWFWMFDNKL